jgi:hypothetical protein
MLEIAETEGIERLPLESLTKGKNSFAMEHPA